MPEYFFRIWLTFSLMILSGAAVVALLAWRAGLFRHQERSRSLPLYSHVPEEEEEG